ncbi:hypothetical protein, partial [Mesorhizobium sp. M5C.F.Ca.IN.020.29.1.1]|uniref:hypothetical protein n=1 Tax=Mesorhizobium sp. M5C.F.Ca.IN.020.29.1.1 TaxID=2496770 RepID=UPI0019CF4C3D
MITADRPANRPAKLIGMCSSSQSAANVKSMAEEFKPEAEAPNRFMVGHEAVGKAAAGLERRASWSYAARTGSDVLDRFP